jgi:hypothetical protein
LSQQQQQLFQDDALAEAAMLWIPRGTVRSESWKLDKDSDVLTTVHTCCGRKCRSMKRQRQFGRAAELLEHLAEEEQFRFLPCPAPHCNEWHWDCRLMQHFRHAHQACFAAERQTRKVAHQERVSAAKQKREVRQRLHGVLRQLQCQVVRKARKERSTSSVDSGVSSSASSPAVGRKLKVVKPAAAVCASRVHYCLHESCLESLRSFASVQAARAHTRAVHG